MARRKSLAHMMFAYSALFALALVSGCASTDRHHQGDEGVWFVHATDPHVFLDRSKDKDTSKDKDALKDKDASKTKPETKKPREIQEALDEKAVSDLWQQISSLRSGGRPFSFLVLTGNLGVEPCSIRKTAGPSTTGTNSPPAKDCLDFNPEERNKQVSRLADLLGQSPVPDIYLVAGDNDIPSEVADDAGLIYFNQFMDEVQKKIDDAKKNVRLHNLTRCYFSAGVASTCYADIPDTSYRLIGFPSYSFKNREPGYDMNTGPQEKQFETFRALLNQARQAGKKVLVVTHIPEIDDPYTLAQDRYAGVTPPQAIDKDPKNIRSAWSTWNVSKKLADQWEEAIASDAVIGVLAGHLPDSHKEIYRPPYTWSTVNDHKTGFSKLYMAPPLSVKNQDTSPIQARGFALVGLENDQVKYCIYWYNSESHDFVPDRWSEFKWHERYGHWYWHWWRTICQTIAWLWHLADPQKSLDRMAVLLIAFLAAFLTVVQVWQIPEPENPLTTQKQTSAQGSPGGAQTAGTQTAGTKSAFDPSPFASNFGKTVITGLGGLAAATALKSLEGTSTPEDSKFYIVWFIVLFFFILAVSAALRAFGEALRERVTIVHPRLERSPGRIFQESGNFWQWLTSWLLRIGDWLWYWCLRLWRWVLSLRPSLLTLLDTFINLIQGKNQTLTRLFSNTIIKQQRNVVCVAQVMRQQLNDLILQHLNARKQPQEPWLDPKDVRVTITVLSDDQSSLYRIARTPASAIKDFPKRSVAWVSVFTGKIRWYKHEYYDAKIVLFDNSKGIIPDGEKDVMLNSYYQQREDDYEAFVIFPFPWPQRAFGSGYVKGAIQISFVRQEYFYKIWEFPKLTEDQRKALAGPRWEELRKLGVVDINDPILLRGNYKFEEKMLGEWCVDDEIRTSLRQTQAILGQLLCGFNENIYKSSKKGDDCCDS